MKQLAALAALTALLLSDTHLGFAQVSEELKALQEEIEALKEGQRTIRKDLRELKRLLRARQAPPAEDEPRNVVLSVDDYPFKGDKNAKLTLIEFTDYQCPFCARHVRETWPQLEKEYISTGKVKYVVRDFPLESIHKNAFKAAEAAHCAGDQGKYWEMYERLFANQKALDPEDLSLHAQAVGLELPKFQQCLESEAYAKKIHQDITEAQQAGVRSTPTFFFGITEPNDAKVKAVKSIRGARVYVGMKQVIDGLLSSEKE